MTRAEPVLRTCVFGEPFPGFWGAVWALDPPVDAFVGLGYGTDVATVSAVLDGELPSDDWALRGEGVELTVSKSSEPVVSSGGGSTGFDQLCRVSGRLSVAGDEREVSCVGYRSSHGVDTPLGQYGSIRAMAALFEPDEAIGLLALRPGRMRGHEADEMAAVIFEPDGDLLVDDPRLSTTYADDGRPARVALELWVRDEQGEDRLRRAAGEALGASATGALDGFRATAELFAWHLRGRDGIGAYLLAERP